DRERVAKEQAHVRAFLDRVLEELPEEVRDPLRDAFLKPPARRTKEEQALLQKHPKVLGATVAKIAQKDKAVAAELAAYRDRAAKVRSAKPAPVTVRALTEVPGDIPTTYLFKRGEHASPGPAVPPGTLTVLGKFGPGAIPEKDAALPTSGRRLAFAR